MLIRENVPEARKLSRRIKIRWYIERCAALLPFLAGFFAVIYLTSYNQPEGMGPAQYAAFAVGGVAALAAVYAYVEIKYRKFVFALREKDFLIQKGVVEKIRYVIPYEKIQNVTVSRDIIDQALGLGTLHIETAAHVIVENDIVLPGISNDENLVTELVARSREAKEPDRESPATMLGVMEEMLDEVRLIRASLKPEAGAERAAGEGGQSPSDLKKAGVLYDRGPRRRKAQGINTGV